MSLYSYINFGSIGSFVGHEISHASMPRYDSEERLLDPWNELNIKLFLSKAKCFVDQYSSYFDHSSDMNVCHIHFFKTFIAISLIKDLFVSSLLFFFINIFLCPTNWWKRLVFQINSWMEWKPSRKTSEISLDWKPLSMHSIIWLNKTKKFITILNYCQTSVNIRHNSYFSCPTHRSVCLSVHLFVCLSISVFQRHQNISIDYLIYRKRKL